MSEYQLCHIRIPFKLYEKIKKISVNKKIRLNAVFAEVISRGFENNAKVKSNKKDKVPLKNNKKVVSSKKNKWYKVSLYYMEKE